jgi:hypothetical protein
VTEAESQAAEVAFLSYWRPTTANPALDALGLSVVRHIKQLAPDPTALPIVVEPAHKVLSHRFIDTYSMGDFYVIDDATRRSIMQVYAPSMSGFVRTISKRRPTCFRPSRNGNTWRLTLRPAETRPWKS